MANTPLNSNNEVLLRDFRHAARMFTDDDFRLAPKFKFQFHVAFSINPAALQTIELAQRHKTEINMLVKSAELPSYTIKTETLNQYNRKKNVQTGHTYTPINIKFHDDNMGLANELWQNYYSYYYADPTSAQSPGAYNRTAMKHMNYINNRYGFDNGSQIPFFNYITIYQMARHEYISYTLQNPILTAFSHSNVDHASTAFNDLSMTVAYEGVSYNRGDVSNGDPQGFGTEHYDTTPSPLVGQKNSSASPSFTAKQNLVDNSGNFLNQITTSVNSASNSMALSTGGIPAVSKANNLVAAGGLNGISFPQATASTDSITATPYKS